MHGIILLKDLKAQYERSSEIQETFGSFNKYALYVCEGDYTVFDETSGEIHEILHPEDAD